MTKATQAINSAVYGNKDEVIIDTAMRRHSVEFAEWIGKNGYKFYESVEKYGRFENDWIEKGGDKVKGLCHHSTEELYEIFNNLITQ